jgi:trypsin
MGVEVKMISNEECAKSSGSVYGFTESYQGQITSSMMCAKDQNEDSCQGDSGGPLVVKGRDSRGSDDVQVGVVSWG